MATELDPQQGRTHSPRMPAPFDTLAASEALQAVGVESGQARAIANQLRLAAGAGQGVTHPELEAALARLETKLLDRIAESERALLELTAETNAKIASLRTELLDRIAESERGLLGRNAETNGKIASLRTELLDRIAESERRTTAQLWRLFGGIVAVAGVVVALIKYLP